MQKVDKLLAKAAASSALKISREIILNAWEEHGTAMPDEVLQAIQGLIQQTLEVETTVLKWAITEE
jgi:hypothetical protein